MQKTRKAAQYLSKLEDVKDIWLFGSYAMDEFMHHSDVDLCVVLTDDIELTHVNIMKHIGKLELALTFEFHVYTESEFDTLPSEYSSFVARQIVAKGVRVTG